MILQASIVHHGNLAQAVRRNKREKPHEIFPGPSEYKVSDRYSKKNNPKFTFGSHKPSISKLKVKSTETPGPGQYEPVPQKYVGCSFSRSRREYGLMKIDTNPGPGSYSNVLLKSNNDSKSQKGFGLSKRLKNDSKLILLTPGPGNYNIPTSVGHSASGVTFKHKVEDLEFKYKIKNPGPCDYNTESIKILHKKSPACILRPKDINEDSKSKIDMKFFTPGPASYLPKLDSVKKISAKCKLNMSGRNSKDAFKLQTPGPGAYTYDSSSTKGTMFPKSKRIELSKSIYAPGPGAYSPSSITLKQIPSYTLRAKDLCQKAGLSSYKDSIPGPGMYNPLAHRKANSIGFGKSKRGEVVSKSQILTPGPGTYTLPSKVAEIPYYEAVKLNKGGHS